MIELYCLTMIAILRVGTYRHFKRKADAERVRFLERLGDRRFPICPNCGAVPEIEWSWANVFSECPECAMEFTRNQWFGKLQADDYPGGPLYRFRFRQ